MRRGIVSRFIVVLAVSACLGAPFSSDGVSCYVHPTGGDDSNSGTSPQAPFRTLTRAGRLQLQPGDRLLLAAGEEFAGQVSFNGMAGTAGSPIVISSYPATNTTNQWAIIDARGRGAGVLLKNCAYVEIANLWITADGGGMNRREQVGNADMRCGVLIRVDQPREFSGFSLSNIVVKDVFFEERGFVRSPEEVRTANGTQSYGWGIRFINTSSGGILKDIAIRDCRIERVSHTGLKFTAPSNGVQDVKVDGVVISHTGGPGVQMSGVRGGHFTRLDVNGSGSTNDTRNWGRGSGLWTWESSDVIIEKSRFRNANGPGDSAGVHIDFNCRNVIVQYNLSVNNAGGFCEILGNNHNCAYRYNVSVNDGHRVKGKNGAFQEGKMFWLSGYMGDKNPRQGPYNTYFYNNTIYVRRDIDAKIAIAPTARGVLIANNIFCIEGRSKTVLGDQNHSDAAMVAPMQNVVFRNNLFLRRDNWPADLLLQDQSPIHGDPGFQNGGGLSLEDYAPSNARLVRNRGVQIPRIPGDRVGLAAGLKMDRDILGSPVLDNPDLGAIEMAEQGKQQLGLR